jgi:hypothetical protein
MTDNNTTQANSPNNFPNNSEALLNYLVAQANSGQKNWFGFHQQRLAGIHIAYEIAKVHADKMTPDQVAEYALKLNNAIYTKLVRGE